MYDPKPRCQTKPSITAKLSVISAGNRGKQESKKVVDIRNHYIFWISNRYNRYVTIHSSATYQLTEWFFCVVSIRRLFNVMQPRVNIRRWYLWIFHKISRNAILLVLCITNRSYRHHIMQGCITRCYITTLFTDVWAFLIYALWMAVIWIKHEK